MITNIWTGNSLPRKQILKFLRIKTKPVIEKFKNWIRHIRMSFYPYLLLALSGSGMICNVMSLFIFAKQRFRRNFHRLLVILAIYDFLVRLYIFPYKNLISKFFLWSSIFCLILLSSVKLWVEDGTYFCGLFRISELYAIIFLNFC